MTNKVKPFYIRITDDMTPQMVQDAFDKCVDAGAVAGDKPKYSTSKYYYDMSYSIKDFDYLGVTNWQAVNTTRLYMNGRDFGSDAQEITLDQLDEWLGLEVEQEWKNGDECRYLNSPVKHYFVGLNPLLESYCYIVSDDGCVNYVEVDNLSKPETPEQKAERERLEAAYDLYNHVQSVRGQLSCKFDWFSNSEMEETRLRFLAIVDKTNYRKR